MVLDWDLGFRPEGLWLKGTKAVLNVCRKERVCFWGVGLLASLSVSVHYLTLNPEP